MKVLDCCNKYVKDFRSVRNWYNANKNEKFSLQIIEDKMNKGLNCNARIILPWISALIFDF